MPFWLIFLVLALLVIASIAVLAPTGVNEWFNDHRWVLPAVSLVLVITTALIVGGFSHALRKDQVAACESGNPEKVGEIENLEHDRATFRGFRDAVRKGAKPPTREFVVGFLTKAIEQKSEAIGSKVAARAQFSAHPGAEPTLAVIKNCEAAYAGGGP